VSIWSDIDGIWGKALTWVRLETRHGLVVLKDNGTPLEMSRFLMKNGHDEERWSGGTPSFVSLSGLPTQKLELVIVIELRWRRIRASGH
jgi:hypothetical protein